MRIETCKKCGSENITTRFVAEFDNLKKTCTNCGFNWVELPLDFKKTLEGFTSHDGRIDLQEE